MGKPGEITPEQTMDVEQVKEYQRTTSKGQTVTVKAHERSNDVATAAVLAIPGRPPMAAASGKFAGGRFLPGVWISPPKTKPVVAPDASKVSEVSADPKKPGAPKKPAGRKDLTADDIKRIMTSPTSPKSDKVVQAAAQAILGDPNTVTQ